MTDSYNNSLDKRKLIVPLVMLLMCMMCITGFAYAYSSTVLNIEDNPVNGVNYSIDYTDGTKNVLTGTIPTSEHDLTVYTEVVVGKSFDAYVSAGSFTRTIYVTVFTDTDLTVDLNAHVILDNVFATFITVSDVTVENVAGNTATAINLTFNVANKNLNEMGLSTDITDRASYNTALAELLTHKFNVTVTAEPN